MAQQAMVVCRVESGVRQQIAHSLREVGRTGHGILQPVRMFRKPVIVEQQLGLWSNVESRFVSFPMPGDDYHGLGSQPQAAVDAAKVCRKAVPHMRMRRRWFHEKTWTTAMRDKQCWQSLGGVHSDFPATADYPGGPSTSIARPAAARTVQTFASTLPPIPLMEWTPLLCTFCSRLLRKFCNEACEAALEPPAPAAAALPPAP